MSIAVIVAIAAGVVVGSLILWFASRAPRR
jgi:hypothetical protein